MISQDLYLSLCGYVVGEASLAEFEDAVVPLVTRLRPESGSDDARALAVIELGLAELGMGMIVEEQFREVVRDVLRQCNTVLVAVAWPSGEGVDCSRWLVETSHSDGLVTVFTEWVF